MAVLAVLSLHGLVSPLYSLQMKNNLAMTPVQTQIVFTLSPLFIAGASWFTQRFTLVVGRVWSVILVNLFGVGCLLAMVYMVWVEIRRVPSYTLYHYSRSIFGRVSHISSSPLRPSDRVGVLFAWGICGCHGTCVCSDTRSTRARS